MREYAQFFDTEKYGPRKSQNFNFFDRVLKLWTSLENYSGKLGFLGSIEMRGWLNYSS